MKEMEKLTLGLCSICEKIPDKFKMYSLERDFVCVCSLSFY